MSDRHLHIISFDIPYPADYGGVIDVFYKLKALKNEGVKIHLHCFEYGGRKPAAELKKYCDTVDYYPRDTSMLSLLSMQPYIVKSRISKRLRERLLQDDYPVLCEGLHCCGNVFGKEFERRNIILRAANVEHEYYAGLAKAEKNILKKLYFLSEAYKLKIREQSLPNVKSVVAISDGDYEFFKKMFPYKKHIRVWGFGEHDDVESQPGKGDFVLFHGNLSVAENVKAAEFIIEKVSPLTDVRIVLAGKNPPAGMYKSAEDYPNVEIIANPSDNEMKALIKDAHINLLITFQPTGFKLKLLRSLMSGRFVLANAAMTEGTGALSGCVHRAENAEDIAAKISELMLKDFDEDEVEKRKRCLPSEYFNGDKARKIIELL